MQEKREGCLRKGGDLFTESCTEKPLIRKIVLNLVMRFHRPQLYNQSVLKINDLSQLWLKHGAHKKIWSRPQKKTSEDILQVI